MLVQDLFIILFLFLVAWAWWYDRGIKQRAFGFAKRHCDENHVQLLDDNVRITGVGIGRNHKGQFKLKRQFKFEFTSTGDRRHEGSMTLLGSQLENINLGVFQV